MKSLFYPVGLDCQTHPSTDRAAAGVSPSVGLRPPYGETPAAIFILIGAHYGPDRRAAIIGPVCNVLVAGHTIEVAGMLAGDIDNLVVGWGSATAGWLLAELAPVASLPVLEANALSRIARLTTRKAE